MTERLYYTDARLARFSASVVAVENHGRHVVLDRTAFYPTSGGQRYDTGRLGTAAIVDVIDEESRVVHVCAEPCGYAVGEGVEGWNIGDRVYYHGDLSRPGGYAEYVAVPAWVLYRKRRALLLRLRLAQSA